MKTLYEILEVSKTASTDEIQKAYHKLAKRWHPDKNSKNIDEANKRFKEMGYANEILKDPVKREKYDYDLKNNNTVTYTEQRNPQTNQYYNHLDASIYSAMQFYYVLAHLNPEERSILFNKWKNTLQELVKNIDDFNLVLKYLNNKERLEFFELMKTRLPTMYQKIADSVNIYSYIKIEEVKESLPSLIPSLRDFYELMENCDEQERAHVFDAMKTLLPALAMKEYQPFIYIFTFLTDEQRATAFELLKPQLAKLIKDWSDLENTLDYINAKQFKILIDEVKANLVAKLDGNLNTFAHKIEYGKFSQGQIEAIVLVMKEDLKQLISENSSLINICRNISIILKKISEPQANSLLQDVIDHLPWRDLDKHGLEEDIFKYYFITASQRLMVLQKCQCSFSALLSIKELNPFLTKFFPDPDDSHQVRKLYFSSLMGEFKDKINLNHLAEVDTNSNDKVVFLKLHDALVNAAQTYFNQKPNAANSKTFQNTCQEALEQARTQISHPNNWNEFFAILGLAIISLGIVPAVLAISAKIKTGSWQFSLFKSEPEKVIDEMEAKVQQVSA